MPETLSEKDWDTLLWRIRDGKCTPFLGAGACCPSLPTGSQIAQKWSQENEYPLPDKKDLTRVAQFLAVDRDDPMFPKDKIVRMLRHADTPDFEDPNEPHGLMAQLPLPIYLTTNYDDFMMKALTYYDKNPQLELCKWNKYIKGLPSIFESTPGVTPTAENPIVFHLHGYWDMAESLVLSEDDYLDFLVNISRDQSVIPPLIQKALTGASLLFIGYRLADWNFRVLLRGLVGSLEASLRRINVAVQLPDTSADTERQKAKHYLTKYFGKTDVRVYWGTANEFTAELRERWETFLQKEDEK